jgi:CheY-like chemotaxis protein
MLSALKWFLINEGFKVVTACSADEALLRLRERLPDLIVTDYTMPGMTGLELCRVLRASPEMHAIPIILHTARSVPVNSPLYNRTFTKPADFDAVVGQIRVLLRI